MAKEINRFFITKELCTAIYEFITHILPDEGGQRFSKLYSFNEKIMNIIGFRSNIKVQTVSNFNYLLFSDNITLKFPVFQNLADFESINHYFYNYELSEGEIVVDAGAYVGVFSMYAGKKVGKKGKVIALEPNPKIYQKLCSNIILNGLEEVVIPVNKGLWSFAGELEMVSKNAISSISCSRKRHASNVKVSVSTLDSILSELDIDKIDFVKMDIEGAEIEALKGMQSMLSKGTRFAIASYHELNKRQSCHEVEREFRSKGYECLTPSSSHLTTHAYKKNYILS